MQRLLFLIVTLLFALASFGQKEYEFIFEEPDTVLGCLYDKVKVMDMRNDKGSIGYIKTGAFNRNVDIVTQKPLDEGMSTYFSKLFESNTKDELVILVYGFWVEDRPNAEEMGTIYFDMDFYAGNDGGYSFVGTLDTLYEIGSKKDVTKKLLKATQYLLKESVVYFATIDVKENSPTSYSVAQMKNRRRIQRLQYPIYNTPSFKNGIYRTELDFIEHNPLDTAMVKVLVTSGNTAYATFHYLNEKGKKGATINGQDYFAICNDGKWFAGGSDQPTRMEYKDGDFYAVKRFRGIGNDKLNPVGLVAPSLFGMAGSLVYITVVTFADDDKGKLSTTISNYEAKFDPAHRKFRPVKRLLTAK